MGTRARDCRLTAIHFSSPEAVTAVNRCQVGTRQRQSCIMGSDRLAPPAQVHWSYVSCPLVKRGKAPPGQKKRGLMQAPYSWCGAKPNMRYSISDSVGAPCMLCTVSPSELTADVIMVSQHQRFSLCHADGSGSPFAVLPSCPVKCVNVTLSMLPQTSPLLSLPESCGGPC